jgi:hypothetical protein
LLAEHAEKCLKVEYLGRIENDLKKSRVTGSWDHKVSVSAKKSKNKSHACVTLICDFNLIVGAAFATQILYFPKD